MTNRGHNSKTINFSLFDPERVQWTCSYGEVEVWLDDSMVITVYRRNPFKFSIVADINGSLSLSPLLTVYKVVVRRSDREVFDMVSSLGVDANRLFYNNVTRIYLFHNGTCVFRVQC